MSAAVEAELDLEEVLITPDFLARPEGRRLAQSLPTAPIEVEPRLLEELADSDSPRGLVALARLPSWPVDRLPRLAEAAYVYVQGVQDPGNLGAIARLAEASGATALITAPGSVRPTHPRALRGSAGSLLRLPFSCDQPAEALERALGELDPRWSALVPHGGEDLYASDLSGCRIFVVGAEGQGLEESLLARCSSRLTIPLAAPVESLNAATAAAIVLFEWRRRLSAAGS